MNHEWLAPYMGDAATKEEASSFGEWLVSRGYVIPAQEHPNGTSGITREGWEISDHCWMVEMELWLVSLEIKKEPESGVKIRNTTKQQIRIRLPQWVVSEFEREGAMQGIQTHISAKAIEQVLIQVAEQLEEKNGG